MEYPVEIHDFRGTRVRREVPEERFVDGEAPFLRRWENDEGMVTGREWIYSDPTTLKRLNSRERELQSRHYGSDQQRIDQPFDED